MAESKRVIMPGETGTYSMMLVQHLNGKVIPAILAQDIASWCNHNRLTGRNIFNGRAWTYMSLDYIVANLHPEFSREQVRRGLDTLISEGIIEKFVPNGRTEKGQKLAACYSLTEEGAKYFPHYIDIDTEPEIEASAKSTDQSNTKTEAEIRAEVYEEVKKQVLADLRMGRKQKRKQKEEEKRPETPVPTDEEVRNILWAIGYFFENEYGDVAKDVSKLENSDLSEEVLKIAREKF